MADISLSKSGIYCIRNIVSGQVYVGSSIDIPSRWKGHYRDLQNNRHHSKKLQLSWTVHGESAFTFEILELVIDTIGLINREQHWMDFLQAASDANGFNMRPMAASPLGTKWPMESRAKFAESSRNRTAEHAAKIRASLTERNTNPEQIAKLRPLLLARNRSPEQREKTANSNRARKWSDESRAKISFFLSGRARSTESRLKQSLAMKGRKIPPERAEKHRAMLIARNKSAEHREKVSASNAARKAAFIISPSAKEPPI